MCKAVSYDIKNNSDYLYAKTYNKGTALSFVEGRYGKVIYKMDADGCINALKMYFFVGGSRAKINILINDRSVWEKEMNVDYPGFMTINNVSAVFKKGDIVTVETDYNADGKTENLIPAEKECYGLKLQTGKGMNFVKNDKDEEYMPLENAGLGVCLLCRP